MLRMVSNWTSRGLGLLLMLSAFAGVAQAQIGHVPEIDPASAASALGLLAGVGLLAHDKFRRK